MYIHVYAYIYIDIDMYVYKYLSIHVSVGLSVYLPIYLNIHGCLYIYTCEELKLSYHNPEAVSLTIHPYYGDLALTETRGVLGLVLLGYLLLPARVSRNLQECFIAPMWLFL